MTPYRERREKGYYDPKGKGTQSTKSSDVAGLGTGTQAKKGSAKK